MRHWLVDTDEVKGKGKMMCGQKQWDMLTVTVELKAIWTNDLQTDSDSTTVLLR